VKFDPVGGTMSRTGHRPADKAVIPQERPQTTLGPLGVHLVEGVINSDLRRRNSQRLGRYSDYGSELCRRVRDVCGLPATAAGLRSGGDRHDHRDCKKTTHP
jgi:hypothetical protein